MFYRSCIENMPVSTENYYWMKVDMPSKTKIPYLIIIELENMHLY